VSGPRLDIFTVPGYEILVYPLTDFFLAFDFSNTRVVFMSMRNAIHGRRSVLE